MTLPYLDDTRIAALLDYPAVVHSLQAAFDDLARGQAQIHARQRTDSAALRLSSMGAIWNSRNVAGLKIYPTVRGQFSFLVTLFDLDSNRPLAVLDGEQLTRFRTAGLTAMVARRAARKDSRKLALIGAGFQGRAQAQALCHYFALDEIAVVDPAADARLCAQLTEQTGVAAHACTAEVAVRGADIVVTATRSAQPVFDGQWLKPGTFVSAMGISAPKGRELDDATLARADRIIVEWKPQSLQEAGELVLWNGSAAEREKIVDLPALCASVQPWRARTEDIIVCKSVGVGLSDVACAHLAYTRSVEALA